MPRPPLPSFLRFVALGSAFLAAFVMFASWFSLLETFSPLDASGIRLAVTQQEPVLSKLYGEEALSFTAALTASLEARQSGLHEMRTLRTLLLLALSVCATSLFMSAWRLLSKQQPSRLGMARMLSKTALACAILRTLDGAQAAALARRAGAAFDAAAAFNAALPQSMETTLTVFSATFTFALVALFLWVWHYFKSPSTLLSLEDAPPSPPPV